RAHTRLRRRGAGLGRVDGGDQLALAHPRGTLQPELGGDSLEFRQDHALEAGNALPRALSRSAASSRGCLILRRLGDAGELGISHSGSFPGPAPARLADASNTSGWFPKGYPPLPLMV